MANAPPELSVERAREAVTEVENTLNQEENARKVTEARDRLGDQADIMNIMSEVLPPVGEVLRDVLVQFGFPEGPQGVLQLFAALSKHKDDQEINAKAAQMRSKYRRFLFLAFKNSVSLLGDCERDVLLSKVLAAGSSLSIWFPLLR